MNIAVIGTGQIAHTNVDALLATGRASMAALCNRTLSKAEAFAARHGLDAPCFTDLETMLDTVSGIDAVLINTPHAQHRAQFEACARRGLHIMMEKPLGIDAKECDEMIVLRDRYGVRACVCHTQRYLPLMKLALKTIQGNDLGALRHVTDIINLHYFHDKRPAWFMDAGKAGGGLILTHGAHQIDRIHVLSGGRTDSVFARLESLSSHPDLDSGYQIMGTMGDVSYTVGCAGYPSPHTSSVQLDYEKGSVKITLFSNGMEEAGVYVGDQGGFARVRDPMETGDAYRDQFEALLDHLEGKPSDAPTLEEAADVLRALDAARRSGGSGEKERCRSGEA